MLLFNGWDRDNGSGTECTVAVNSWMSFHFLHCNAFTIQSHENVCVQTVLFLPGDSSQHSPVEVTKPVLRQQKGSHASCGQCSSPMTCLNQQVHVAAQKTLLHVDIFTAVGQQEGLSVTWRRNIWPLDNETEIALFTITYCVMWLQFAIPKIC